MSQSGGIPAEALLDLRRRLGQLPPRHASRRAIVERTADLFGVSRATLYRALAGQLQPQGLVRAPEGLLYRATVNRYLNLWGYDHARMTRAPAAVRFEARTSNALWQFDISPSDLKEIGQPVWIDPDRKGLPVPMLFSVVDDRSGAAYQEYRCV